MVWVLLGRKTSSYKDFKLNAALPDTIFEGTEKIKVLETSVKQDDAFWREARHDSLTDREKQIYHMVDTIKTLPAFRTYVDIVTLFFTGHYEIGKV